jgi:hypothetical protein
MTDQSPLKCEPMEQHDEGLCPCADCNHRLLTSHRALIRAWKRAALKARSAA